jgi:hypothetical protein
MTGLPFSICDTAGASFVILTAVPLYSPVDGSLQGHEVSTENGSGWRDRPAADHHRT